MERMIKRIAVKKDWTISMSEFRNFAEKYQWEIDKLEEENRKLKSERDKWRGKYNRLKSEFNLLKNKIWTTKK